LGWCFDLKASYPQIAIRCAFCFINTIFSILAFLKMELYASEEWACNGGVDRLRGYESGLRTVVGMECIGAGGRIIYFGFDDFCDSDLAT
jgi:hypothetical protein